MKALNFLTAGFLISFGLISCSGNNQRYIDLETGKHIAIVKDSTNGVMVNADTKEPVIIYVDTQTGDTIYGKTGKIINNHVIKTEDGKYKYVSTDTKIETNEDGDYKKKVEADGDTKIKDGDTKIKIDGENGEKKVKKD